MRYLIAAVLLLMFAGLSQAATVSVAVETVKVTSDPVIGGYVVVEVPRYYPLITDGQEGAISRLIDQQVCPCTFFLPQRFQGSLWLGS